MLLPVAALSVIFGTLEGKSSTFLSITGFKYALIFESCVVLSDVASVKSTFFTLPEAITVRSSVSPLVKFINVIL